MRNILATALSILLSLPSLACQVQGVQTSSGTFRAGSFADISSAIQKCKKDVGVSFSYRGMARAFFTDLAQMKTLEKKCEALKCIDTNDNATTGVKGSDAIQRETAHSGRS